MTLTIDDFDAFFAAVNGGHRPFRWQTRLLRSLYERHRWPDAIAAPTGAGKTAVIDVHVFAVALVADEPVLPLPRRLSLVVDRRVLVDDQYEHALQLRKLLRTDASGILGEVARRLEGLRDREEGARDGDDPLLVTRLRGGLPAPRAWRDDPLACQVICATPDMWGSRLLFGGYGTSARARPREAGLLAYDTVLVVDEAHLSEQLVCTARRVAELAGTAASQPLPVSALQVVATTATPDRDQDGAQDGDQKAERIDVMPEDLEHDPLLKQRLCADKPVELLEIPAKDFLAKRPSAIQAMADRAVRLRDEHGPTVGCFVNRVATATALAARLRRHGEVRLVCGRLRPYDLRRLREERPGLLDVEGNEAVHFLVTTQSLEVGVDLDWRAALVEIAPGSAVAQRAGRVNRRGSYGSTRVVVAVPDEDFSPSANVAPYVAEDLNDALTWVRRREADRQGLAPWALRDDRPPGQRRKRTLLQRPELNDTWLWARTNDRLFAEPDLRLWLDDDVQADLDVGIVVRRGLPGEPQLALDLIRALPPFDYEAIPARIEIARKRLDGLNAVVVRDAEPLAYAQTRLRPGDVIVVDDRSAIFTLAGDMPLLDETGTATASDVLEGPMAEGREGRRGQYVFRLESVPADSDDAEAAIKDVLASAAAVEDELDGRPARLLVADALEKLAVLLDADEAARVRKAASVLQKGLLKDFDLVLLGVAGESEEAGRRLAITDNRRLVSDELLRQHWTRGEQPVALDVHAAAVAVRSEHVGHRLGLGPLVEALRLAGLHHDDGKADERFQRGLDPQGAAEGLLAKSAMRSARQIEKARAECGLPTGWRHEQLSVLRAWDALGHLEPPVRDLVARLIGTSHGHGRPGFPHVASELTGDDTLLPTGRRLFDEGVWDRLIERTHSVYGVWGCAYLEAVLRAADGQVSSEGS